MKRILQQLQTERTFQNVGLCGGDLPSIASLANDCIERLIYEGGDSGWWGGWSRVRFQPSRLAPYITLPPQFCRAINLTICKMGVRIQNEFYEMMEASIGLQPPSGCMDWCGAVEGFERGVFSTFVDLPIADNVTIFPQQLRIYPTDPNDSGKQILVAGAKDANGFGIYTVGTQGPVNGFIVTIASPFVTASDAAGVPYEVSGWDSIVKDVTLGDVILKSVDSSTGLETTLSRYLPWEQNPAYRRYYLNNLPNSCCQVNGTQVVQVETLCKYDFRPVSQPTDQLLIGNFPALQEEAKSQRAANCEDAGAAGRSVFHHRRAIHYLQAEMDHYLGKKQPAVSFAPFGTAKLERQLIGRLM